MNTHRYQAPTNGRFRLDRHDTADRGHFHSKDAAVQRMQDGIDRLRGLQQKLYAQDRWSLLIILQAMDAAGKDSAIEHVMSGVNPQGCDVHSFKRPSEEELDHDFLWRTTRALPRRGSIGIFNRSYYEEVLVVRVHPEILAHEKLPAPLVTKKIWKQRYEDINNFERFLSRNGYVIRKFFLHVSKKEQRQRFLARLDEPDKNWKFSEADVAERAYWKTYMSAYEDAIRHTSTPHAPWYVVPADHKWYSRLVISEVIVKALEDMQLEYPAVDPARRRTLQRLRRSL